MTTSPTPSRCTEPVIVHTMVPGDCCVPSVRNHDAPRPTILGMLATVSTLSTRVGGTSVSPPSSAISTWADRPLLDRASASVSTTSRSPRRKGGATRGKG